MAVYNLEEQEQISEIKAWWDQYGKLVTTIAVAAAVSAVGWQGWKWHQNKQAAEAGAIYFALQQAAESGDAARTREAAGQLIERFSGTIYADFAALTSSSVQFSSGDARNARAHLEWLSQKGADPVMRDLARLRLATILLDEGAYAEALNQLQAAPVDSLRARFDDLRGDVLLAEGKHEQARAAYDAALRALVAQGVQPGDTLYEVIQVKSDAVEG